MEYQCERFSPDGALLQGTEVSRVIKMPEEPESSLLDSGSSEQTVDELLRAFSDTETVPDIGNPSWESWGYVRLSAF